MRILIAEDEPKIRRLLETVLSGSGHDIVTAADGLEAWQALQDDPELQLAVLDWRMPGLTGVEICRRLRSVPGLIPPYIILLTALGRIEDIVAGLAAGADDYLTKPFVREELEARLQVGMRILALRRQVADHIATLRVELAEVKQLLEVLPVCVRCKKVKARPEHWEKIEEYVATHPEVVRTHTVCPDCAPSDPR